MSDTAYLLAVNAGSSSVKLSLYSIASTKRKNSNPKLLIESNISNITSPPPIFTYTHHNTSSDSAKDIKKEELKDAKFTSHDEAFRFFLDHLSKDTSLDISGPDDISFACHRIVHGGDFPRAVTINDKTKHYIEQLTDLAPLHNAPALAIVESLLKRLPKTHNVAYFDSAFHTTIPDHIKTYPLDLKTSRDRKIRKYGFHGISYGFITRSVAEYLGKRIEETSIIAMHLGSGASACAIKNGKSLDNSMGLTPLEGLPGATRSGTVDPSLIFHYTSNAGKLSHSSAADMHISKAEEILNKKCGWSAITGTTNFADVTSKATSDSSPENEKFKLALDIFVDRIIGFIGSYYVKLGGKVDALVFAGGIGEKSALLRKTVVEKVECLGFSVRDDGGEKAVEAMREEQVVVDISAETYHNDTKRVLVCKTDEQFEMVRDCVLDDEFWD